MQELGGWMEPLPGVFDILQYFGTILPLDLLNKMRYILWVVALLEACDVTNNGRHLGRHFWILPRIINQVKTARNDNFLCFI